MKTWKENIIADVIAESVDSRVISLREIAAQRGIKHIAAGDVQDIMQGVAKRLEGYRPVQMMSSKNDSLFCSLCWVEDGVTFDSADQQDAARSIIEQGLYDAAVALMDDEISEAVHADLAPCTEQEFLAEYMARHEQKYGVPFVVN